MRKKRTAKGSCPAAIRSRSVVKPPALFDIFSPPPSARCSECSHTCAKGLPLDAAAVDVERVAQVSLGHCGAFDVPSRPAAAERRIPHRAELLVARLRLLPDW